MDAIDFDPCNFLRPPAWRWHRAHSSLEPPRRVGRHDDAAVRRVRRFLQAVGRAGGDADHARVRRLDPALHGAVALARAGGERRWEVEARLLAGQDDAAIAATMGVAPEVVAAYAAVWFDVRSRLAATDWIMGLILGHRSVAPAAPLDREALWKSCAYHLGPLVLDRLVALDSGATQADPVAPGRGGVVDPITVLVRVMTLPDAADSGPAILWLAAAVEDHDHRVAARAAAPVFAPLGGRPLDCDRGGVPAIGDRELRPVAAVPAGATEPVDDAGAADDVLSIAPLRWSTGMLTRCGDWRSVG